MNVKKTKNFKENRPENYHVHDNLDGVEFRRREGPPQEGLPVREEIIEDDAGVISLVVVPDLAPMAEDAMEEESSVGSPDY